MANISSYFYYFFMTNLIFPFLVISDCWISCICPFRFIPHPFQPTCLLCSSLYYRISYFLATGLFQPVRSLIGDRLEVGQWNTAFVPLTPSLQGYPSWVGFHDWRLSLFTSCLSFLSRFWSLLPFFLLLDLEVVTALLYKLPRIISSFWFAVFSSYFYK